MKKERRRRILFALAHDGFLRNFEKTFEHLASCGVEVHIALSKRHATIDAAERGTRPQRGLHIYYPRLDARGSATAAARARVFRDVLFYSLPEFRKATDLHRRFPRFQKKLISQKTFRSVLAGFQKLSREENFLLDKVFAESERWAKTDPAVLRLLKEISPDAVVVSPLVNFFSKEIDFVKAAKLEGIPSILATASWDNLTNKGRMKEQTDYVMVWNEAMADEATGLHGVPREVISITGAPVFDWWFEYAETKPRDVFLNEVGFQRDAPIIFYLCSSASINGGNEFAVIEEWVAGIRKSSDPRLQSANVLVRPHPMDMGDWPARIRSATEYRIFPTDPKHPVDALQRATFYHSMAHAAAVVGLNTSAMIEAAILAKPVLTFKGHAAEQSQAGNIHFHHLARSGCVQVASSLDEHLLQLSGALAEPGKAASACAEFIDRFVRPKGRNIPPSQILAEAIIGCLGHRRTNFHAAPKRMAVLP